MARKCPNDQKRKKWFGLVPLDRKAGIDMLSRVLVPMSIAFAACTVQAEGSLFKVPTRDGVVTTLFWETAPNAEATVLLFPGGGGGFGKFEDGKATVY